jgi:hypothetical protein
MLKLVMPVFEGNPDQPTGTHVIPIPCCSRRPPLRTDHNRTEAGCTGSRHQDEWPGSGRNYGEAGQGEGVDPCLEVNQRQSVAITCARRSVRVSRQVVMAPI